MGLSNKGIKEQGFEGRAINTAFYITVMTSWNGSLHAMISFSLLWFAVLKSLNYKLIYCGITLQFSTAFWVTVKHILETKEGWSCHSNKSTSNIQKIKQVYWWNVTMATLVLKTFYNNNSDILDWHGFLEIHQQQLWLGFDADSTQRQQDMEWVSRRH